MTEATRPLAGRVVGVYGSAGAPWAHLAYAATHGAEVRVVRAEDVAEGRLAELDVFVMPGGGATAMAGLLAPLGDEGASAIRDWVRSGGTYLSSCAGSVLPLALDGDAATALPQAAALRMVDVALANPGDATLGGLASPGVGRIEVRVDRSHPIARDVPERVSLIHYNGPLFDLTDAPESVTPFAWPTGASEAFTPAERFLPGADEDDDAREAADGSADAAEAGAAARAADGPARGTATTVFDRCVADGAATAVDAKVGAGRAILFGSHPEFGLGPIGLGWGEGARLLLGALRAPEGASAASPRAASIRAASPMAAPGWSVRAERPDDSASELAAAVAGELDGAADRFRAIADRPPGAWLDPERAASFHGRDAREIWRTDAAAAGSALAEAASELRAAGPGLGPADHAWLDDAPRPDQDFGAMGLTQMAQRIHGMLDRAEELADAQPARPAHAYDLFDAHPYHLAVATYLSAAGLATGARAIVTVLRARQEAA